MSEYACFLLTLLYENRILKVALKIRRDLLKGDCFEFPMEPENIKQLESFLPAHAKYPILDVEDIFEVEASL